MSEERVPGRMGAIILIIAIFVAPFIALLYRTEAGLGMMALALTGSSILLRSALDVTPIAIHWWLRLGILVNLALAAACGGAAAWLLWQR